ncbi:MAG: L-histidine N(alpha)-methyltransferase [Bacteroidota bacterium]
MNSFAKDVDSGLSASPKSLSSKYFYDDEGSRIFQQIMDLPEYYLTNCELEILTEQAAAIYEATQFHAHFNIVELGAGDGAKTRELLRHLLEQGIDFTYIPIDISEEAIKLLTADLRQQLPRLQIHPKVGDYFSVLKEVKTNESPNLFLFLGANIGNYLPDAADDLLEMIRRHMRGDDKLMVGFDLKKNPLIIAAAYNDDQGITRGFNLNLLSRINRELGGDFDRERFDFYSYYNPINGEVRSFIISREEQTVHIRALGKQFAFRKGEWVYTELSRKYSFREIKALATKNGFQVLKHFCDRRGYFTDSLWGVSP